LSLKFVAHLISVSLLYCSEPEKSQGMLFPLILKQLSQSILKRTYFKLIKNIIDQIILSLILYEYSFELGFCRLNYGRSKSAILN